MRIAIHYKDGSVAAYKFGRIEDGVHNTHPIFGDMPIGQFVDEVMKRAHEEFDGDPNVEDITLERMVAHPENEGESIWISHKEFDPKIHQPTRPGNTMSTPDLAGTVDSDTRRS